MRAHASPWRLVLPLLSVVFLAAALATLVAPRGAAQTSPPVINELWLAPCEGMPVEGFIELYNPGPAAVDLSGWVLQAGPAYGSLPRYTLPQGTVLESRGWLAVWAEESGLSPPSLNGAIKLLDGEGLEVDAAYYSELPACRARGRLPDGGSIWAGDLEPTPGEANRRYVAPTATPSPTATVDPRGRLCLSEFLPAPYAIDWDGDGQADAYDEWIELHNDGHEALNLAGYQLDDHAGGGSCPYVIPPETWIAAGGHRLFYRRDTKVILSNAGGEVRLLAPDEQVIDAYAYTEVTYDRSYARVGGCGGPWYADYDPSPGGPNPLPTPTPVPPSELPPSAPPLHGQVCLYQILPAPLRVDWDDDGHADAVDEWIVLYNAGYEDLDLGGFQLDDVEGGGSRPYTIPQGTVLAGSGRRAFFRRDTKLILNNEGDEVRLLAPDGTLLDAYAYGRAGPDVAFVRLGGCGGRWVALSGIVPGQINPASVAYLALLRREAP